MEPAMPIKNVYFQECTDYTRVTEIRQFLFWCQSWILINQKGKSQLNHTSSGMGLLVFESDLLWWGGSSRADASGCWHGFLAQQSCSLCKAGLFSLLLGLTFATVGESLTWVGVSGGLGWGVCWWVAVWMRCTVTGEDGTGSEQLTLAGDLGLWGVGTH